MSLSNPAGAAAAAGASAYVAALFELLGDRDPMDVLRTQSARLHRAVEGLTEAEWRRPEKPGKWSIVQVIQHQADTELVAGFRLRMVLSHERPPLAAFDQDLWASELNYAGASLSAALREFTAQREATLAMLARVPPEAMRRVGLHAERGEESAAHIVRLAAGHDLAHERQVLRIRKSLGR
jgi:hypothetical protein